MTDYRITVATPETLTETVYLHLHPEPTFRGGTILGGMVISKMTKSTDAQVAPGDYVVKLEVAVPATFFAEAMPSARIELEPGKVVPLVFTQVDEDEETD